MGLGLVLSVMGTSRGAHAGSPTLGRIVEDVLEPRGSPLGSWREIGLGYRMLTNFRSGSSGLAFTYRGGSSFYFHGSLGLLWTPRYEKYLGRAQTQEPSPEEISPRMTLIDNVRSTYNYLEAGPGLAIWPTRRINFHFELGGSFGLISTPKNWAIGTDEGATFNVGAFAGAGLSYRFPSRTFALSLDYRLQLFPYGGVGAASNSPTPYVWAGHDLFGVGHSLGLSAIFRFESDREN